MDDADRRQKHWRMGLTVASLVIATTLALLACDQVRARPDDPAPITGSGPAQCPATRESDFGVPEPARHGDLVPRSAIRALLCVYSPRTGEAARLERTHAIGQEKSATAAGYLNGLAGQTDAELVCPANEWPRYYSIVFEYQAGHALVHIGCVVEYAGAVRYQADLPKLLGFWEVRLWQ